MKNSHQDIQNHFKGISNEHYNTVEKLQLEYKLKMERQQEDHMH